MNRKYLFASLCCAAVGLTTLSLADDPKDIAEAARDVVRTMTHETKLPSGWTQADMDAVKAANTPGINHEFLAKFVGTWQGKNSMWMSADSQPTNSDCTTTITSIMGGRFIKIDSKGETPGMGPFEGGGVYGYDNVLQKFVSGWVDNMSTGLLTGTGELAPDGKTLTWTSTMTCPIQKKPVAVRQVDTLVSADNLTLDMYTADPKTGKEFKMLHIDYTRKAQSPTAEELRR